MRRPAATALSFVLLLAAACTLNNSSTTPGGASSADLSRCKNGCDKMKFFKCNSADEQARCYDDCNTASASQIELFVGCAESSICDPACRTKVQAPDKKPSGASASTCTQACDKLATCSLIRVGDKAGCEAQCQKSAYQFQIDCVNNNVCADIQKTCGGTEGGGTSSGGTSSGGTSSGGTGDATACQTECDQLHFFDCIDANAFAACRAKCTTATTTRDTFVSCARTSGVDCSKGRACLANL
jgi:uncharacterized membrane protein YgcG